MPARGTQGPCLPHRANFPNKSKVPCVLFVDPPRTQFDLNFSLLGIPVRVHPLFWLVCLVLGGDRDVGNALRWVGVVFVSILVHEMGHALVARNYGANPWITLYGFGGLASYRGARTDTKSSIAITLAGPMAGFLFAGAIVAVIIATRHQFEFFDFLIGSGDPIENYNVRNVIFQLLFVNLFWGLVNLLPVFPLDGGQISMELFQVVNPREGAAQALWLSVIVGATIAAASFILLQDYFLALFFGYMAYNSYALLTGGFGPRR